jgi:sulfatase maturation enzyme AslB (radical SAM superfamily)
VFDPLAVCLVIAYNSLIKNNQTSSLNEPITSQNPMQIIESIFKKFKRGTKKIHNPEFADPNLKENN